MEIKHVPNPIHPNQQPAAPQINPNENGAPLRPEKPVPKQIAGRGSIKIWGDNPLNDFFIDLLRILRNQNQGVPFQEAILKSRTSKDIKSKQSLNLKKGIDLIGLYFQHLCKNEENNNSYVTNFEKKAHLGLTAEQLGFRTGIVLEQCPQLDLYWAKVVSILSEKLGTNKMAAFKCLRRYVRQQGIFSSLYEVKVEGLRMGPKQESIKSFFKEQSSEYLVILSKLAQIYFQQFNAYLCALVQIIQNNKYAGLKDAILQEFKIVNLIWEAYLYLSDQIKSGPVLTGKNNGHDKLQKETFIRKIKLFINFLRLFQNLLQNCQEDIDTILVNRQNFLKEYVERFDKDIVNFQKLNLWTNIDASQFSKLITSVFLLLFPFKDFALKQAKGHRIAQQFPSIQSQPLKLIKLLMNACVSKPPQLSGIIKQFEQIIARGQWNAFDLSWKQWLGIFLRKFKQDLKSNNKQLTKHIVYLCKKVISSQFQMFFDFEQPRPFYLEEISEFLTLATNNQYQSALFNGVSILPICTKLMGGINKRFTFNVTQMLGQQTISNMFLSIISSLKIGLGNRNNERSEKIIYVSHNQQPCFEQQIKFICRLIQIQADNIQQLQQTLFNPKSNNDSQSILASSIKPNPSTGLLLIVRLMQIFYAISPDTISDLKCLRYIIKAINYLFMCQNTRKFVCIAFAAVESGKNNYTKSLKAITSRCYDYDTSTQIGRQSQKLRKAISFHINNILKISDSLDQYFPTTNQKEATHLYRRLNDFLQQQNFQMAYKLVQQMIDQQLFNSKAVQWLYQFIKLFQSRRQTSIDLDSIKHLLLKMRMKNQTTREYFNLSLAIDILNNGNIHEIIIKMLTPIVKSEKNSNGRQKHFLGLANQELEGFMTRNYAPSHENSFKYANKFYRLFKIRCNNDKDRAELYGKISGSLSIIQTILRLNAEGDFPLLQKLQLNNFIIKSLFGESPHMYSVKFKIKMKKSNEQKFRNSIFAPQQMIQKELQNSVSLIHCIASYWDLEQRLNLDQTDHPSSLFKLKGHFSLDTELTSYLPDVLYISQENILTDITKKAQTIGISTVCRIMQNIIYLGEGKKLYFSILSRNYPIGKGLLASDSVSNSLTEFIEGILYVAKRRQATFRQRQFVVQLLSVFLQEKHFGQYLKAKIYDTKQAMTKCRQISSFLQSSRLTVQFLLFLNYILISDASDSNIRFVKSCLVDPIEYCKKLIMHCQTRLASIRKISEDEKKSKYATYVWCLEIREASFCRMALFLFLGISSYIIANDHPSLASSLTKLILLNSQVFLKKYNLELDRNFGKKIEDLKLLQSIPAPQLKIQSDYTLLNNLENLNAALLNSPFSLAQNYLTQPWQIIEKYSKKDYKQLVLGAYRDNSVKALFYSNQSLAQYYYLLLSNIFQRGYQGLYDVKHQKSLKQMPQIVFFNKQKAKNQLSYQQLTYEGENISSCCFRILRSIQKEIWQKQSEMYIKSSRDCALITVIQIIKNVKNIIMQDSSLIPESYRIIDKFINYMKIQDDRINLSTKFLMIQAILDLTSSAINRKLKDLRNNKKIRTMQIFTDYFRRIQDCIDCILNERGVSDPSKLPENHLNIFLLLLLNILQTEIANIQLSINQNSEIVYLENQYRLSLLEKIKGLFAKLINILQMPKISTHTQVTIIKLFSKGFNIDSLGKNFRTVGLMRLLMPQIFQKIQKLCLRVNEEDHFFISNLYQSLWEISILNQIQARKYISRLLKSCQKITTSNLRKLSQIKTLGEINQVSQVLSVYGALSLEQNWRSTQYKDLLDSAFILIQEKPLKIEVDNIVPQLGFEVKLSQKYFDKKSSKLSLFSIFSAFSIFSMIKNYLFFSFIALRQSPTINDLCNNTFNKGIIDDLSIDRLRESFGTIITFLQRFQLILKETDIQNILKMLNYAFKDSSFLFEFQCRPFNFENYQNKQDFFEDIVNTIGLLLESVGGLEQVWERYDWKSTQNWRPNKQDLAKRKSKLLDSYCSFFKDKREVISSERLKKLQYTQRNIKQKIQF